MGVVVLRKARSRKRTLVGIAFLVFATAVLAGGLFAFLPPRPVCRMLI